MLQPMFRVSLSQVSKVWTAKVLGTANAYQTAPADHDRPPGLERSADRRYVSGS